MVQTSSNVLTYLEAGNLVGPTCKPCNLSYQSKLQSDEFLKSVSSLCNKGYGKPDNCASPLYEKFKRDDQVGQRTFSTNPWRYTPQVNTHSKDLDELKLSEKCFK